MNDEAKALAAALQTDTDLLVGALRSCADAIRAVDERFPGERLQIRSSPELALWAHYRFSGDWKRFADLAFEAVSSSDRKSQVWILRDPSDNDPEPLAVQHLDRFWMRLNVLARELGVAVPKDLHGGWEPIAYLERLQAFVCAANETLNPG